MSNIENTNNNKTPNYVFNVTFNPEIFRIIGYVGFIVMLVVGSFLTNKFSGVDPQTTTIYKLFGFNHSCYVIDYEPSRTVSAMLLPFWEIPFVLYIIFSFLRVQDAYREKKAPLFAFIVSAICLPIALLLTVWVRIVFVWNPEVNFMNHYLPYIGLHVLFFLIAFENFLYFYAMKALPFNNNRILAIGYLVLLLVVTLLYVVFGMSSGLGHPILDLINNNGQRLFFRILSSTYTFLVLPIPLILSFWEIRRSPKHTLSLD